MIISLLPFEWLKYIKMVALLLRVICGERMLYVVTSAVKRLKYLITINRINVIVNSHNSFFYAKYPLISLSH